MTFKRNIYYRRKKDSIIIEGKSKGKTIYFVTLPHNPIEMLELLELASYFPKGKYPLISRNLLSLDYKTKKNEKLIEEDRTVKIVRTQEEDAY